ncbi:MAG: hypothetical protein A2015_10895 [Spirochaetes bacterium GWF1_31_7]|nr:MAG: hypothetical protein A2Y30_13030 [Spirochaetes bacterium GWE1_32_154]OHD48365.1 MAG: hypothetical protein A2015_10895 [Spirochaetes bacterium GWF1_31_7]OHD50458.1 MAG: hypothetical protein A2Y29_11075 [Spirochaetes bacterium GWE2_31_10]OHD81596.1 MAG: hypothetical protein A2355_17765 [Spirochaetes bacterium RIFOXYB1_FULL_32_8]
MKFDFKDKKKFYDNIRNRILTDINIKITCFILAVIMYVLVSFSQLSEKSFTKKINIKGMKGDFVISNNLPDSVRFVIKDKKRIIERVSEDDFNIVLDLSEYESKGKGTYLVKLQWTYPKIMKSFFSGIEVSPEILSVTIESIKQKNIPISVPTFGNVKSGYMIKERKVNPSEVRVQGPESVIESITSIDTEKIDISEASESFERIVKLNNNSNKIKVVGPADISVFYAIARKTETKTFKVKKVTVNNLNQKFDYSIENLPLNITLSGSETIMSAITENNIYVSIDVSNANIPGEYNYRDFNIEVPADVNVVTVVPRTLIITIEDKN